LSITNALTIAGPGADQLTISGNAASRVFEVGIGVTVTLSGQRIADSTVSGLKVAGGSAGLMENGGVSDTAHAFGASGDRAGA
jgi:hypothetical protein